MLSSSTYVNETIISFCFIYEVDILNYMQLNESFLELYSELLVFLSVLLLTK